MVSVATAHLAALDSNNGGSGEGMESSPLRDDDTLHNYCRLLCQIKRNYRLSEILVTQGHEQFLEIMARFTIAVMHRWRWLVKSMNYVIGFWSKLVIDLPYINQQASCHEFFKAFIPELVEAIINARVDSVPAMVQGNQDALGDFFGEGDVENELRFTPVMYRYQYESSKRFLQKKFTPMFSEYKAMVDSLPAARNAELGKQQELFMALKTIETQLACFLYYLGAALGGGTRRALQGGAVSDGEIDAELASWFFQLLEAVEQRVTTTENSNFSKSRELELAKVHFLRRFSDTYLAQLSGRGGGYSNQPSGNSAASRGFYALLSQRLDRPVTQASILGSVVDTIIINLQLWSDDETVLTQSVAMLTSLTSEYGTIQQMVTLDSVATLLRDHQSFSFLSMMQYETLHTDFYASLGKLAFRPLHLGNFQTFMAPLSAIFEQIVNTQNLRTPEVRMAGMQLCGFLRGVLESAKSSPSYVTFFDWIYPAYLPVLSRLLETWFDEPPMTTAVLRFYADLVYNRNHRIDFGDLSANSVLLFQEVSKVMNLYTTRISTVDIDSKTDGTGDALYEFRLQGLTHSLNMLTRILSGMYVNFGVMRFYEDKSLTVALNNGMKLILSIPLVQALEYDDASNSYFAFIEVLCGYHQDVLADLESPALFGLIGSLHEGLTGFAVNNSSSCASALDSLFSYRINEAAKPVKCKTFLMLEEHFSKPSSTILLNEILSAMFSMILFDNAQNYWSLARCMCTLIICHRNCFDTYRQYLTSKQVPDSQGRLADAFELLMKNIDDTASTSNKEQFCHNVAKFQQEVQKFCVPPEV
jgi:hypothetical protein